MRIRYKRAFLGAALTLAVTPHFDKVKKVLPDFRRYRRPLSSLLTLAQTVNVHEDKLFPHT